MADIWHDREWAEGEACVNITSRADANATARVRCPDGAVWHSKSMIDRRQVRGPQGLLQVMETGGGVGIPVIFLHADSGAASQWLEVQQAIGADRHAVAFDFRGHGGSQPARNEKYDFAARFEDVLSVADAVGLQRFLIAAHSGGAAVALEGASTHSPRIAGLFLLDPPNDPRAMPQAMKEGLLAGLAGPKSLDVQKEFYASIAGSRPDVRERVLADCEAVTAQARLGVARAFTEWDPEPTLNAWRGPIHVVASQANDNARALHKLRSDLAHTVVPGVGHWIQLDDPSLVIRELKAFVQGIEAGPVGLGATQSSA